MSWLPMHFTFMASHLYRPNPEAGHRKETQMSAQTYQAGANFKTLNETDIVAASETFKHFFPFSFLLLNCVCNSVYVEMAQESGLIP